MRADSFDVGRLAAGYRAGRTFATNGPLVDLRVAGAGPGDEVRLTEPGQPVCAEIEAVSIGPLDRAELIVNGRVFKTFVADAENRIAGTCPVPVAESLWIAAKVTGPRTGLLASTLEDSALGAGQIAHTSPVYVIAGSGPIRAGRPEDADYFARWCDAVLSAWSGLVSESSELARHDGIVRARIGRAKSVFAELKAALE